VASERVAIGTDGWPSDLRDEAAALRRLAAAHEPATAVAVLERRLAGGHDLVREHFGAAAFEHDGVEFAAGGPAAQPLADRVVVGGRTVVEHGALVTGDLDAIERDARREATRLWTRMAAV
jgi:hypothetical protein